MNTNPFYIFLSHEMRDVIDSLSYRDVSFISVDSNDAMNSPGKEFDEETQWILINAISAKQNSLVIYGEPRIYRQTDTNPKWKDKNIVIMLNWMNAKFQEWITINFSVYQFIISPYYYD